LKQLEIETESRWPARYVYQEIENFKKLAHDRIIEFLGTCWDIKTPTRIYLVFEYAEYGSLNTYRKSSEYNISEAPIIALQIAEGIEFLHSKNYAHRDIKPSNILITKQGEKKGVKLADFGNCRLFFTGSSNSVGTLDYQPPEIWVKCESYLAGNEYKGCIQIPNSLPVDIFSFGITLWQLYHPKQELYPCAGKKLPPITNCDDYIQALILKCCQKRPEDRYTASQVVSLLRSYQVPSN